MGSLRGRPVATVRVYEELNDYLPRQRRKVAFEHPLGATSTVGKLLASLGIPAAQVDLVLVNGRPAGFAEPVRPGDRVAAYPVFERFDLRRTQRLRPTPLRHPEFVADPELRALAARLRLLGFEARVAAPDRVPPGPIRLTTRPVGEGVRRALVLRRRPASARAQALEVLSRLHLLPLSLPGPLRDWLCARARKRAGK